MKKIYITEVSKKTGLSVETLRYYERVGLIPKVARTSTGLRSYGDTDICWIEFIKCMRDAGVPIDILVEYVALCQQGEPTRRERARLLAEQMRLLDERIAELQRTREKLHTKISSRCGDVAIGQE
ncbi:MerR family transcriptional regulator [Cloacibacillus porcorum]